MENGREIMHVDLEKTHFPDNYFDVIMTSEVFEHVARPYKAFQEIYRILKPGGIHVMTVPHHTIAYNDVVYAEMRPNQTDPVLLLEPVYHGEPNPGANNSKGVLVFTIFGAEMVDKLASMGYNTEYIQYYDLDHGLYLTNKEESSLFIMNKRN